MSYNAKARLCKRERSNAGCIGKACVECNEFLNIKILVYAFLSFVNTAWIASLALAKTEWLFI